MGILIWGAGIFLSIFLGVAIFSLVSMAQKADEVYDWLDCEAGADAESTCASLPSPTILWTDSKDCWLPRCPVGLQLGKVQTGPGGMPLFQDLQEADLQETS